MTKPPTPSQPNPKLPVAVVGCGRMGKLHARVYSQMPQTHLVGVYDANRETAEAVAEEYKTQAFHNLKDLLPMVAAATIAVPTKHHAELAEPFLHRGVACLIEKPLAKDPFDCRRIIQAAEKYKPIVQVGHIERFNPAVRAMRRLNIRPQFMEVTRISPLTFRSIDVGVVLDMMIHDIDIVLNLAGGSEVTQIDAVGVSVIGDVEDICNARLTFANGCVANLTASRISPRPMRRMRIWAPEGYAKADFARRRLTLVQPSAEVRCYGLDPRRMTPAQRATIRDDLFGKYLQLQEVDCQRGGDQLTRELQDFVNAVRTKTSPRVPGTDGRNAIALAERILTQIRAHAWDGRIDGPNKGPDHLPTPLQALFPPPSEAA